MEGNAKCFEGMKMANSNHLKASVCITYLIVLSCTLGLAGAQNINAGGARSPGSNVGAIVNIAPPESVLILEMDSFEYTLSTLDQFLQGILPIPMGTRMMVRAKFGEILGNPMLAGVDMNGTFGAFVVAPSQSAAPGQGQQAGPGGANFVGIVVPVTDYNQFITSNPNCTPADSQGVSKLKVGNDNALIKQVGSFALITQDTSYDKVVALAKAAASGSAQGGADVFAPEVARKPVRLFVDVQKALAGAAPAMEQMKQGQAAGQQGQVLPPMLMNLDLSEMAKNVQYDFVTIGLSPSADVLNASVDVVALPNSKLAAIFTRGSQELANRLAMLKAKPPSEMGTDLAPILALLPDADKADFVGTFNLAEMMQAAAMVAPVQLPATDVKVASGGAIAFKADNGAMTVDVALPKKHLSEILSASMAMNQTMGQSPQMPSPPQTNTVTAPAPVVAPVTVESASANGQLNVRVAGARLVRYSDMKQGILPLGQTDGYTLSLLADLPEPALKISGGVVEKARTSTGKSLLPQHAWQRNIRFFKLSSDRKAALFDVELGLPDYDVKSLDELSGQLVYVTGSGGKEIDLGVMTLKAGAKGQALNAVVTSVEEDLYGNNATVLRLKLDTSPESLKSVSLVASGGSRVAAEVVDHITLGKATTFRLAVKGKVPGQARIILTVYEQYKQNTVPFSLRGISLTGEPLN